MGNENVVRIDQARKKREYPHREAPSDTWREATQKFERKKDALVGQLLDLSYVKVRTVTPGAILDRKQLREAMLEYAARSIQEIDTVLMREIDFYLDDVMRRR